MSKVGRNDPCTCGSGKKYKKCCEDKVKGKKFEAKPMQVGQSSLADKMSSLSHHVFRRISSAPQESLVDEAPKNVEM